MPHAPTVHTNGQFMEELKYTIYCLTCFYMASSFNVIIVTKFIPVQYRFLSPFRLLVKPGNTEQLSPKSLALSSVRIMNTSNIAMYTTHNRYYITHRGYLSHMIYIEKVSLLKYFACQFLVLYS